MALNWRAHRTAAIIALAILTLGIGFGVKSRCLRTAPGPSGTSQLDWSGGWPWSQFCYSDVITLYGLEQFDKSATFPYKTSWVSDAGTPAAHSNPAAMFLMIARVAMCLTLVIAD